MPDLWTHILGGELILKDIADEDLRKKIEENRRVFYLGCQGPDIFFYNDFWPWLKEKRGPEAGEKLHQENFTNLYGCSRDFLGLAKSKLLEVYFCGILAHYVFDRLLHPFIFARTDSSGEHKKLEINLDSYFVDRLWGEQAFNLSPVKAIDIGEELPESIEEFYRYLLSSLFNYRTNVDFINDSYRDMKRFLSIFYCPENIKYRGLKVLNFFLTLDLTPFLYPRGESEKEPEFEFLSRGDLVEIENLFGKACRQGAALIDRFRAGTDNTGSKETG